MNLFFIFFYRMSTKWTRIESHRNHQSINVIDLPNRLSRKCFIVFLGQHRDNHKHVHEIVSASNSHRSSRPPLTGSYVTHSTPNYRKSTDLIAFHLLCHNLSVCKLRSRNDIWRVKFKLKDVPSNHTECLIKDSCFFFVFFFIFILLKLETNAAIRWLNEIIRLLHCWWRRQRRRRRRRSEVIKNIVICGPLLTEWLTIT